MSRGVAYLFAWLALGLPYDTSLGPDDAEQAAELPDMELLEFLGGLDDAGPQWQEFFGGMAEQIADEDGDER